MKTHTNGFKTNLKSLGREISARITYNNITLTSEDINTITYSYQGDILKSVMKQLDLDTSVNIPLKSEITLEFGLLVSNAYEYLNYGTFIVERVEKREDTNSYMFTCYDKMLYAQKEYENLNVAYPITIRNYISAICTKLGLTFQNASSTFPNYDKQIPNELYLDSEGNSLNYTFRDVLDELAQVTASTICINDNGNLELRYINNTSDTIDEEYLKNVNVNFGEQFGAINTIVFSRSAGADKISLSNPVDLADEDKIAIEIADNQILNGLDRGDYLSDILTQLYGLSYYLNDFESTGICYYDLCDRYNVSIGENTYSCIMLNDEINITQGLKETIYTERPLSSEQEYEYMDSDDRWKSRTTLIVNKHTQQIQSVVSQIGDRTNKTTTITQDIDTIQSEVQNMPVITTENSGIGRIVLNDLASVKLAEFKVHPTNQDILGLLVSPNTITSSTLKVMSRRVTFDGPIKTHFKIPKLYYYNSDIYDEFIYNATNEEAYVIRRVAIDNLGNKSILQEPYEEQYEYKDIQLEEGNYNIYVATCSTAYIYAKGMLKNEYTKTFATSYEVNSKIEQKAKEIDAQVSEKVNENEVIAKINLAIEEGQGVIYAKSNSIVIDSDNFKLDEQGNLNVGGYISTAKGIMTNLQYVSGGITGYGGFYTLGYMWDGDTPMTFEYSDLFILGYIPEGFEVVSANIVLSHTVCMQGDFNNNEHYGYAHDIRVYKAPPNRTNEFAIFGGTEGSYHAISNSDLGTALAILGNPEITNEVGRKEVMIAQISKDNLPNGDFLIVIRARDSYNSFPTTFPQVCDRTGLAHAVLNIIGYMKIDEPMQTRNVITENNEQQIEAQEEQRRGLQGNEEEPLNTGEPNEEEESDR